MSVELFYTLLVVVIDRAARHGHQLNGKLSRLAQQEAADEMSTRKSDCATDGTSAEDCQQTQTKSKKKKKVKRTRLEDS